MRRDQGCPGERVQTAAVLWTDLQGHVSLHGFSLSTTALTPNISNTKATTVDGVPDCRSVLRSNSDVSTAVSRTETEMDGVKALLKM